MDASLHAPEQYLEEPLRTCNRPDVDVNVPCNWKNQAYIANTHTSTNLHYPMTIQKQPQDLVPNEVIYTKKQKRSISSHHQAHTLPSKPTLDILPTKVDFHVLLALSIRVDRAHHPLRPLQRALIALLRLLAHEADQVA